MNRRIDLYRREKRDRTRSGRPISVFRHWQIVFALFAFWSALAALFWLVGFDFTAEKGYRKLTVCGFAHGVLPDEIGGDVSCLWWNLAPFYIFPTIALIFAIGATLKRLR